MRNAILAFIITVSVGSFGCAGTQSFDAQLAGVQKAIATLNKLAQASPLSPELKAQLAGWEEWERFILGTVGVVKDVVNPTGL